MATNLRQLQSFISNPMIAWKEVPDAESYTFKWEDKRPNASIFPEINLIASSAIPMPVQDEIPDKLRLEKISVKDFPENLFNYYGFTYSQDLPVLEELVPYSISATANKDGQPFAYANAEIIIIESRTRDLMKKFIDELEESKNTSLEEAFYKLSGSLAIGNKVNAIKWAGPRPNGCQGIAFDSEN